MTATELVILVDEQDNPTGIAEKLAAHRENLCHRAFSVFIYRYAPDLQILLQQRAANKYHSSGLWTNTCCSHPRPGEEIISAGERRLKEEMGIQAELRSLGYFHYIAPFANGLTENEVDHVLIGVTNESPITPNPAEVQNHRWVNLTTLKQEMTRTPDNFTPWLAKALALVEKNLTL